VFIPLTVGGGVRAVADVQRLLNAGADKVGINTSAVLNPQLVKDAADRYGSQCIVSQSIPSAWATTGSLYPWRPHRHRT